MNTETTVHPKLQHYGLTTANLDAMIDWRREVLGMTVNHRSGAGSSGARQGVAPLMAAAFVSNDEVNHRVVFFEVGGAVADPDKGRHARVQHIAFAYQTLDDLLGTYVRLKGLGIAPAWAADHGPQTAFYYADPDHNIVELNVNNYGDEWSATEHIRSVPPGNTFVDPDKMLASRKAGATPWNVHQRAVAGELAPAIPYDLRAVF